jgi:hypothetical protein
LSASIDGYTRLKAFRQRERHADGGDQRDEPRCAAQRPIRDALDRDGQGGAGQHPGHEHANQDERPGNGLEQAAGAERQENLDAHERPEDEDLRVREVDELEYSVDHRVAERDEGVHEAEDDAVEEDLGKDREEKLEVHGCRRA